MPPKSVESAFSKAVSAGAVDDGEIVDGGDSSRRHTLVDYCLTFSDMENEIVKLYGGT